MFPWGLLGPNKEDVENHHEDFFFFDSRDHSLNENLSMGVKGEGYRQEDGWEMGGNRPKPNSIT